MGTSKFEFVDLHETGTSPFPPLDPREQKFLTPRGLWLYFRVNSLLSNRIIDVFVILMSNCVTVWMLWCGAKEKIPTNGKQWWNHLCQEPTWRLYGDIQQYHRPVNANRQKSHKIFHAIIYELIKSVKLINSNLHLWLVCKSSKPFFCHEFCISHFYFLWNTQKKKWVSFEFIIWYTPYT